MSNIQIFALLCSFNLIFCTVAMVEKSMPFPFILKTHCFIFLFSGLVVFAP